MYMGEIARQVIIKLVEAGCLFNGDASDKLQQPMSFFTKYISEIERSVSHSCSYQGRVHGFGASQLTLSLLLHVVSGKIGTIEVIANPLLY